MVQEISCHSFMVAIKNDIEMKQEKCVKKKTL